MMFLQSQGMGRSRYSSCSSRRDVSFRDRKRDQTGGRRWPANPSPSKPNREEGNKDGEMAPSSAKSHGGRTKVLFFHFLIMSLCHADL